MKKIFFLVVVASALFACETTVVERKVEINKKIIDLQVNSDHWVYNNGYYRAKFNIPDLTKFIYDNGLITMSIEYQSEDNTYHYQVPLPSVRHFSKDNSDGTKSYWTRTIDFDFLVGGVDIYVTNSDFFEENPGNLHFLLKMVW